MHCTMSFLFASRSSPKELAREHKRSIVRHKRSLDKEQATLKAHETKTITQLKKEAAAGQPAAVKALARDLSRTRKAVLKIQHAHGQFSVVEGQLQTAISSAALTDAMKGLTTVMTGMNKSMGAAQMKGVAMEFEKQSDTMELTQEMMDDALDGMTGDDDEDDEDEIVNQILDELGVKLDVCTHTPHTQQPTTTLPEPDLSDDLEARLAKLKTG